MEVRNVGAAAQPDHSARRAGLRYVNDEEAGFRRVKQGQGFAYLNQGGRPLKNPAHLKRIRSLAIPPAWTDVWICPDEDGHLQATGRDARGRKQHRYHPRWREVRDETKFTRMIDFARTLPRIRKKLAADSRKPELSREKVLATVVRILETGCIRVGNDEYVKQNNSFGLTTMRDRHVKIKKGTVRFEFRGKSGKHHAVEIQDPRLARIVRSCRDIPGQDLFQYYGEDGGKHRITSSDVNEYIREISASDFTAKDFRTWAGTVLAAEALAGTKAATDRQAKRQIKEALEKVAGTLGNTPAICRKSYVHPAIFESFREAKSLDCRCDPGASVRTKLSPSEKAVLKLLQTQEIRARKKKRQTLEDQLRASLRHRSLTTRKGGPGTSRKA